MTQNLIATTSTGQVQGIAENGLCLFRGIPYAEAPTGTLRFKKPVAKQPWAGIFDATRFGPASPQVFDPSEGNYAEFTDEPTTKPWVGSEDSLKINVWTPALDAAKRPVIVWIHGGANWLESSRLDAYNGAQIAQRGDAVVFSFNYRLGIFGWVDMSVLGGDDYKGSHSNGLRDQLLALQWIKANAGAFGGDADNITVMGESAGSIDLSWLLSNGHLNGIARRVVLMSGIAGLMGLSGDLGKDFSEEYAQNAARTLLGDMGYTTMAQLQNAATEEIMDRFTKVAHSVDTLLVMDSIFWPRLMDGFESDPFRAPASASKDIDVLIGYTAYEMGLWLTWDQTLDQHSAQWSAEKMPYLNAAQQLSVSKLYGEVFAHKPEGRHGMYMIGDSIFTIPSLWFADARARAGVNIWMYQFDWESDDRRGALHAADQTFLFNTRHCHAGINITGKAKDAADEAARETLAHAMQDAVVAFARKGDPNAHGNPALPHWPRYTQEERAVMGFDIPSRILHDPAKPRREWWYENIYAPALADRDTSAV